MWHWLPLDHHNTAPHSLLPSHDQVDPNPGPRDPEENIEVHRVTVSELLRIMESGAMLPPSIATCYKALQGLRSRGMVI